MGSQGTIGRMLELTGMTAAVAGRCFGATAIHREMIAALPRFRGHAASFRLPAGLKLLQRTTVGHYGNLRDLGARFAPRAVIERILDETGN